MAYGALVDKVNGNTFAAADWNQIADNFEAGAPDIFTAAGDLAVGTGANAADRLAVGATDGMVLQVATSLAKKMQWAGLGGAVAKYKIAATVSVATSAATIINYGTSILDPDTAVTTGASWKYTVPAGKGGYFFVIATAEFQSASAWGIAEADLRLYKNGSFQQVMGGSWAQNSSGATKRFLLGLWFGALAAGDYIDVRGYQTTGATKTIDSAGDYGHIDVVRLFG